MKIIKSTGINRSENRLAKMGDRIFLNLWSYPNPIYKDKTPKELADLFVVCGNHVLIFSDKDISFSRDKEIITSWKRWEKKAILESIQQLYKAEHRVINTPDRIFLDAKYQTPFPLDIPDKQEIKIHLICIANGAQKTCQDFFRGGTGSLMYSGKKIYDEKEDMCKGLNLSEEELIYEHNMYNLFTITDYFPNKSFVHIFNDNSFPFILEKLDTLSDFVAYLTKKEELLRRFPQFIYSGEEDLLFDYIKNYDETKREHTFSALKNTYGADYFVHLEENWDDILNSRSYKAKIDADKNSYWWDNFISTNAQDVLDDKVKKDSFPDRGKHEGAIRYMALESRLGRRIIVDILFSAFDKYPMFDNIAYRTLWFSVTTPKLLYVLVQVPNMFNETYEKYRKSRLEYLKKIAFCAKAKCVIENKEVNKIVGIAMEPPKLNLHHSSSEFILLECNEWSEEEQIYYEKVRQQENIFMTPFSKGKHITIKEFPDE